MKKHVYTEYADSRVVSAVDRFNVATLRADLTRPVPRLQNLLVSYGGAGLPYAFVLNRGGDVVARFSGLFTVDSRLQARRVTTRVFACRLR